MRTITSTSPMATFQNQFIGHPLYWHFNHRAEPPAHEREEPDIVKFLKFAGLMN